MNYANFITLMQQPSVIDMNNIAPPPDQIQLVREVERLKDGNIILSSPPYILLICDLTDKPALRQELGRQREITFRSVG